MPIWTEYFAIIKWIWVLTQKSDSLDSRFPISVCLDWEFNLYASVFPIPKMGNMIVPISNFFFVKSYSGIHIKCLIVNLIHVNSQENTNLYCFAALHYYYMLLWSEMLVAQSCPTLCDPMDCSPPGSSVHGILQTGILEWVAPSRGDIPNSGIEHRSPAL